MNDWSIDVLERVSTTDQATQTLRAAITSARIPQGTSLRETQLASMLGTGRSAVREAIRQLVQEGLVEHELHRGARVRLLGKEDVEDIYSAREAIEPFAAGLVLRQPEDSYDVVPLQETYAGLEKAAAAGRTKPPQELIDLDIQFHEQLVALAGSERLSKAHSTLAAEARMVLHHHPDRQLFGYAQEHEVLLAAVVSRDERLPELVSEHLQSSAATLTQWLVDGTNAADAD